MKTYIIESHTNYGLMVHIVNAESKDKAYKIAQEKGAWDNASIHLINTKKQGLVYTAYS